MMKPDQYKVQIVEVLFQRLKEMPNDLPSAFSLIWAIDVYAVHVACHVEKPETSFKDSICDGGGWQFRILREASNATKHAIRRGNQTDVDASDKVKTSPYLLGWAAWCAGSRYLGQQICIDVVWKKPRLNSTSWIDIKGLCCANQLTDGFPLTPDGFMPLPL
ncbi:hypothetical protein [Loktanella fryxellensis]|uniref:hypothetical protein n=1 Tax=Loktanella fryxellensis TaxID=245187 RepID=UPI00116001EF|nr:hypothetical protein [Loktanella fryxellensis]